jgi:hypothetical protein
VSTPTQDKGGDADEKSVSTIAQYDGGQNSSNYLEPVQPKASATLSIAPSEVVSLSSQSSADDERSLAAALIDQALAAMVSCSLIYCTYFLHIEN